MTEWRDVKLGTVADLLVGYAYKSADFTDNPDHVRLLRGVNIGQGTLDWGRPAYWRPADAESSRYRLQAGDVVLAMDRPWIEAGLKRSRVRRKDLPALLVQRVVRLRGTPAARTSFIHHLIASEAFSTYIQAISTGATVPHISQSQIAGFQLKLPPLDAQDRICDVLDGLDDVIENNRRRVELLEQMAQAIYREWFVRFRYPGHEDATLVDSSLGLIPEGWEVGTINQLVDLIKTTVEPTSIDPATPAVGLEHIPRRQLTLDSWGTAEALGSRKSVFEAGDILFGKIRPYFHKVSVAPMDGVCSTDAIVIRPSADYWGLAVLTIFSDAFVANATQTANGTKMPRAEWKVVRKYPTIVPPLGLALRFTTLARHSLDTAQRLMLANRQVTAMRDLLLPKLVTGHIDVSELDLDAVVGSVA